MCVGRAYLGLDEDVLDRLQVRAEIEEPPHDLAQHEVLSGAAGEAKDALGESSV